MGVYDFKMLLHTRHSYHETSSPGVIANAKHFVNNNRPSPTLLIVNNKRPSPTLLIVNKNRPSPLPTLLSEPQQIIEIVFLAWLSSFLSLF